MTLMVMFTGSVMQLVFQAAILTLVRTYDRSTSNYMQRMQMVKVSSVAANEYHNALQHSCKQFLSINFQPCQKIVFQYKDLQSGVPAKPSAS